MTEPASVRAAGLDQPAGDEPCLDVNASEWVGATRELVSQGFTFFDWLTAVDETDGAEDAGFDVVLHLLDVSTPGALRGHLLRTRIADGAALPSLTGLFAGARLARAGDARDVRDRRRRVRRRDRPRACGRCCCPRASRGRPLRKSFVLAARASKPWPGAKEPGEGHDAPKSPGRRRVQAPGVPPPEWGPR